jgi:hypothetical protein
MNHPRADKVLVGELGDSPYPSRVRPRPRDVGGGQSVVVVRPTIVINALRSGLVGGPQVDLDAPLKAARLRLLLEESLTRPLGSMQSPSSFCQTASEPWAVDSQTPTEPRLRTESVNVAQWLDATPAHAAEASTCPAHPRARKGAGLPTYLSTPAPVGDTRPSGAADLVQGQSRHLEGAVRLGVAAGRASAPAPARQPTGSSCDARRAPAVNALRASAPGSSPKLRAPAAPPRSSAATAGILDGWERAPSRRTSRRRLKRGSHRRGRNALWAGSAVLGACSMLLAYALTSSLLANSAPERFESGLHQHPRASETAGQVAALAVCRDQ